MIRVAFKKLHPTTQRLLLARAWRSVGQGALIVDFALYLHALHWSGTAIGLLLSAAGFLGAALSIAIGVTSDRLRRKPFLLVYEGIALLGGVVALLTARTAPLAIASILNGFGRGANGAAGPFSPAEQAWLAEEVEPRRRGWVFSLNTALGFFGMGLGALFGMLPAWWRRWLPGAAAYRPVFALVIVASVANLMLVGRAREQYRGRARGGNLQEEHRRAAPIRRRENRALGLLVFINAFNGLAIGLTGPLIAYWFMRRFHVGVAAIAPVLAATFLITGVSSLLTGKLSERVGIIQSVVWARLVGLVLLVLIPLTHLYWLASLCFILRSAFNRGSAGARQALAIGLVREERHGLATSLNTVSFQMPQAAGPGIAGSLLDLGQFSLPFYAAAVLQGIYLAAYARAFSRYEPRPLDTTEIPEQSIPKSH